MSIDAFRNRRATEETESRALDPQEVSEAAAHFERAQQDGLTDAQREVMEKLETEFNDPTGYYQLIPPRLDEVEKEIADLKAKPAGREKYDRAYWLLNQYQEDLGRPVLKPPVLWESSDPMWQRAKENERVRALIQEIDALDARKKSVNEAFHTAIRDVREEYERSQPAA